MQPRRCPKHAEGDRRIINGQQHELQGGQWVSVAESFGEEPVSIEDFGVSSVEELESAVQTGPGCFLLSFEQASRQAAHIPPK